MKSNKVFIYSFVFCELSVVWTKATRSHTHCNCSNSIEMSASMNSENAVAGDLFAVSGIVNGSINNNNNNDIDDNAITNSTANDMSSTSTPPPNNANIENDVAKCTDRSSKMVTQIDNETNSARTTVVISNGGGCGASAGSKSWYARCNNSYNRLRSQSCDRRHRNMIRYSWNIAAINRQA